ncbi:hypothetical protein PHMEG_00028693 [Phytophthora megakarya]|uniref:Uncharacterized protein n=1 Tax=Phytophthora megakarya TaxID=4795 RepID=A0A225V709_9STRA|nr:hypothetical protein PHMEG_00028693 [Phytophthora megakarya]
MERQEQDTQEQEERSRRTHVFQEAIAALQQQRAEILRQMQQDTAIETQQSQDIPQERQIQVPIGNNEAVSETQYSIGGVVTLEPLSSSQQLQVSRSTSGVSFQPVAAPAPAPTTLPTLDAYPRYRNTPDALNDVFSLQLKFAETMLKLEKSVQMRDQLLHHSVPKRRVVQTREQNAQIRRGRHRRRSENGSNSDSSVMMHRERSESFKHDQSVATEPPEENQRTPTTGSSVTTPTTGSDQKSASSSSKQVRFGDDAYSTPVIARKFNFDGPSMDDDEDEEKHEEAESVLSFLGGSSVTSAELNDTSFLRAFERFRRELQASRGDSVTQSPSQLPLARQLFPAPSTAFPTSKPDKTVCTSSCTAEECQDNPVESATKTEHHDTDKFPALNGLSIEELQEQRRQLCLDIQAETAQFVLSFGAMQNVARSQDAELTKNRLLELRNELKAVDVRLSMLQ